MEKHRRSAFWQKEAAEKAAQEATEKAMQEQWRSHSRQESVDAPAPSAFTFTPFKEPSGNRVEIADPPTGTLKRPTVRNPNYNTLQPTRPSLKFDVQQQGGGPPTRADISRTWGRPGGQRAPQMGSASIRASSVMGGGPNGSMTMGRPASRASEAALGMTRYQSYCTLPRPEDPLDTENLVAAHLAAQQQALVQQAQQQQQNVFYVPFQTYSMPPPHPPSAATLPRPPPQSVPVPMTMPPPQPPPDFRPPVQFYSAQPEPDRRNSPLSSSDLVPWESVSLMCYLHVLLSVCIFLAGGLRIYKGAKWAIGVEMVYAILIISNAFLGLFAVARRHVQAVMGAFVFSGYNLLLAALPLLLGLMPWFADNSLSINPKWFISESEPFSVDYCLVVLVMFEAFICGLTMVIGCRSIGNALHLLAELRSNVEPDQRPIKC